MAWYKLDGTIPIKCSSFEEYHEWEQNNSRNIKNTIINIGNHDIVVSTIFLGLDYQLVHGGIPILFETCIFGGDRDGEMTRYCIYGDAVYGHVRIVKSFIPDYDPQTFKKIPEKVNDKRTCRRIHLRR